MQKNLRESVSSADNFFPMRSRFILSIVFGWLAALFSPQHVRAEKISVAAAADLVFCLEELDAAFEKTHSDLKIEVTAGSSGNFFAQIQNGAPFDLFLSADLEYPRKLAQAGFAEKESLTTYAIGRIVLWTMKPDLEVKRGLEVLADPAVHKIAIANPEHAPYGRAAKAALEHEKLWETLQPKIVLGENIAQTLQFVQSGNADAGLIAKSLALAPKLAGKGRYFEVPASFYPPLEQVAVITKHGAANGGAKAYLAYLLSPEARAVLDHYGFQMPREK